MKKMLLKLKIESNKSTNVFPSQVLLKECDDFRDDVCPGPSSSQDNRGCSHPDKGSVDINQWIAEEIQNCVIPTVSRYNVITYLELNYSDKKIVYVIIEKNIIIIIWYHSTA